MLKENWRHTVEKLVDIALSDGSEVHAFWSDHFYSSRGKFGYPVYVHKTVHEFSSSEITYVVGWVTDDIVASSLCAIVENYIVECGGDKTWSSKPLP